MLKVKIKLKSRMPGGPELIPEQRAPAVAFEDGLDPRLKVPQRLNRGGKALGLQT